MTWRLKWKAKVSTGATWHVVQALTGTNQSNLKCNNRLGIWNIALKKKSKQILRATMTKCSVGEGQKSKQSASLFCSTTELLVFEMRTADQKKKKKLKRKISFHFCQGTEEPEGFSEAPSVLPETVIESQGSCFQLSIGISGDKVRPLGGTLLAWLVSCFRAL